MIARILILTPFNILIAKDEQFPIFSYEKSGYKINFYPPVRDEKFVSPNEPSAIKMNGKDAFFCNVIRIEFQKDKFDRSVRTDPKNNNDIDPPLDTINEALNDFLIRLRHVTQAHQIHQLYLPKCQWRIEYYNDDGTELPIEKGMTRARGSLQFNLNYTALNAEIWNDVFTWSPDLTSLYWVDLLLDGRDELPEIGASIVLTFTALEIFIANILNQLATKEKISPEFWQWINNREWYQEPHIKEQYDVLLKNLTGHSLKEEENLWQAFINLKTARDTFVHEGMARISKKSQKPLEEKEAIELINLANKIPFKIREWLPKEIQWDLHKNYNFSLEAIWPLSKKTD